MNIDVEDDLVYLELTREQFNFLAALSYNYENINYGASFYSKCAYKIFSLNIEVNRFIKESNCLVKLDENLWEN